MNRDEQDMGENQFSDLLAAYDDALASGRPLESPTLRPELAERVAQAQACLRRLEQHRRDALESASTPLDTPPPEGLSLDEEGGIRQVGRWQFLRELGRGGSGIVYLAWDPLLHREVAVKVPRPEVLLTPELRRRFLREAQAAGCFEHPNLVPVYEAGEVRRSVISSRPIAGARPWAPGSSSSRPPSHPGWPLASCLPWLTPSPISTGAACSIGTSSRTTSCSSCPKRRLPKHRLRTPDSGLRALLFWFRS